MSSGQLRYCVDMVGDRVREARRRMGWKQIDLAVALGMRGQSMISEIEGGQKNLNLRRAIAVAQALGVSLDYLAGLADDPAPAAELADRAERGKRVALLYLELLHHGEDPDRRQELDRLASDLAAEDHVRAIVRTAAELSLSVPASPAATAMGLAPVTDRRLAELLSVIADTYDERRPDERRELIRRFDQALPLIDAGMSRGRAALARVVAYLGWRAIGGAVEAAAD